MARNRLNVEAAERVTLLINIITLGVPVKVDQSVVGLPPVFRIHGELGHLSGSLLPEESVRPSYSQLPVYIFHPHEAYRNRVIRNENLSPNIMRSLQKLMLDHNAYTPIYRNAYEILQIYNAPDYTVKLRVVPANGPRRYNLPTTDDVIIALFYPSKINFKDFFQVDYDLHGQTVNGSS